jgi:hypothetical protein
MTTTQAGSNNNKRIWIGLGAALLFCLCAVGVAAFLFMRVGQQVMKGTKTDPVEASKAAHAIADYELPEGYQERVAMNFLVYSMVMIGPDSSNSTSSAAQPIIMLAQFKAIGNQQQMEQQIRQSFEQQAGRRGLTMKVVDVKKMTIRGEDVEVTTYEGTDNNGFTMRQLITAFPGKDGTAMLMIMGAAQNWNKAEMSKFVESIH